MFSRALVPIDGSGLAFGALDLLAEVLEPSGEVLLVSVIDAQQEWLTGLRSGGVDFEGDSELSELSDLSAERIAQAIQGQRDDAVEALAIAAKRVEELGFPTPAQAVLIGSPGQQIVRAASERQRDIIVITSHGWSGLKRAVLGSVAEYVVRHNREVPVLLAYPHGASE